MPQKTKAGFEQRAKTLSAVPPLDRRDALAKLLNDQDVETLPHLVNERMDANALRALTLISPNGSAMD